jgi:hypothetical protein
MTVKAPVIDGELNDDIWKENPISEEFTTYNPIFGEKFPQKTLVWTGYDSKNIYFAFKCFDTEPEKIKTSITRRDNMFHDDWVGVSIDSMGNKQTACGLFVNPNGIQGDVLNSVVSGEDDAPDFVWESAGKVTEEGYQVEIRIPLRSIRFKSGDEVTMGILFLRRISRLGMSGSWPALEPGVGLINLHTDVIYKDLKSPLNLEILPSATLGRTTDRESPQNWEKIDSFEDFGIGLKYGITSSITTDITINPDFSQVESDAFQVEVNRRYPIFYEEKRPFFMEGTDIFDFFVISHGFFRSPVHTRRIVDPLYGAKLTGTVGKTSFGIISAGDAWPGLSFDSEVNPYEGKKAYFNILRTKQSLGGENYIGALYSGRDFAGGYNRVGGLDLGFRFLTNHQLSASFLQSFNKDPEEDSSTSSSDYNLAYAYITRALGIAASYEHIGKDFEMDSGFLLRTGIDEGWIWINPNIYPKIKNMEWLQRISPHFTFQGLHDHNTDLNDYFYRAAVDLFFTKQGFLSLNLVHSKEGWDSQVFDLNEFSSFGRVQLFKWLFLEGRFIRAERIYYDGDPSYKGDVWEGNFGVTLQPNAKLSQSLIFHRTDFNRDKEDVYDVNIIYSRTTYQFNKYFFLRAILQYNSFQKKLLTDLLASFTFIPGTVLHVGYGGLHERRSWQNNSWIYDQGNLTNTRRSFFFKASYLWRF